MPILCPTDLSPAADRALALALLVAKAAHASVTLLHVARKGAPANEAPLEQLAARFGSKDVTVQPLLREGAIFDRISEEAREHDLMVAGTHGVKGLREALMGTDMLRLVRRAAIPTLVVQEQTPDRPALNRIVMPVGGHAEIGGLLDDVTFLARLFGSEVLLFQVERPGAVPSPELLENKRRTIAHFEATGIRCRAVNEPASVYSMGFAEQTVRFAEQAGAGCIAIMAEPSPEFAHIADADKERLLTNSAGIPVLCSV